MAADTEEFEPGLAEHIRFWRLVEAAALVRPLTESEKSLRESTRWLLSKSPAAQSLGLIP